MPHRSLAHKLDWYGVRNKSLAWITAFLKDRTQRVLLDGETSTPRPVTSGVPQGTVLGPVLLLAYINDLHESITNSNVRLFADDCVLYRDITDRNDTDLLQQDLDALGRWEAKWLMEFNVDKWFIMHATHSKHKIQHQYTLHNQTLAPGKHSGVRRNTTTNDGNGRTRGCHYVTRHGWPGNKRGHCATTSRSGDNNQEVSECDNRTKGRQNPRLRLD